MPDKTKRSGVGQAWIAQQVGISLYSALIMILLPRKPFFENSRLKAVYKTKSIFSVVRESPSVVGDEIQSYDGNDGLN